MSNTQAIKLNGTDYLIFTDEPACDVVDQLMFAADEAGWMPAGDQSIGEWAEDTALVLIARSPRHAALDTVIVQDDAAIAQRLADEGHHFPHDDDKWAAVDAIKLTNTSASDVANSANPVAM